MKIFALLLCIAFATTILPTSPAMKFQDQGKKVSNEIGSQLTPKEVEKFLELHNKLRAEVKAGDLVWSSRLASYAQEWADHLIGLNCAYEHRPESGQWAQKYGENLAAAIPGKDEIKAGFKTWEDEKKLYNGKPLDQDLLMKAGHYTQAVWKETKEVGCAKASCKGRVIFVCNYDPPGNMMGETPY